MRKLLFIYSLYFILDDCWKQRDGDYILQGQGEAEQCYETLQQAKDACASTSDCMGISTQTNICNGYYRLSHGIPTFIYDANWRSLNMRSYEYVCRECNLS